jgi:hypothetical protein
MISARKIPPATPDRVIEPYRGTIAKSNDEVLALMNQLKEKGTVVTA